MKSEYDQDLGARGRRRQSGDLKFQDLKFQRGILSSEMEAETGRWIFGKLNGLSCAILAALGGFDSTPSGLMGLGFPVPRVARASQPWAE